LPDAKGVERLRRIRLLVSVFVVLVLAATMAALPAAADSETEEGNPKNGFGAVTSQKASETPDDNTDTVGKHASDQEEPRQGVGNVARTEPADGDHVGDHACFIGDVDNDSKTNCEDKPGKVK